MNGAAYYRFAVMRKADVQAIAQLDADVFGPDAWSERAFHRAFADPANSWFVIKDEHNVVAYCLVEMVGRDVSIASICTARAMQGKGLGTILLTKAIHWGFQLNCLSIKLEVHEKNSGAQRLYERFGFRPGTYTEEPYYSDGAKALRMRLSLKDVDRSQFTSAQLHKMMRMLNEPEVAA